MNFQYTVNVESDEPVMLINKHIGYDETDGFGIMGDLFQAELLALDQMEKKRIQVWINSVGGIVMDGYNIYNAILKSKTKVDTYCVGICASIAGVIFQAGRNRIMADYGKLMYHNPFGGSDQKSLDAMKDSLVKMVSGRSGKSDKEVSDMFNRVSWIGASEAIEHGLCDSIEYSRDKNKRRLQSAEPKAMFEEANLIVNKLFENKNQSMKTVANKLGLNPEASEEAIVAGIAVIENKVSVAEARATAAEAALAVNKAEFEKVQNELKGLKDAKEAAEKAAAESDKAAKEVKAKNMIEGFAKMGKIKNDAATIELWTKKAVEDHDGVKAMIEALPVNKSAAAKIETSVVNKIPVGAHAQVAMLEIAAKNKQ
jgi:ATP-dependent Clp endopeptidase proteolytic subunit ClpP